MRTTKAEGGLRNAGQDQATGEITLLIVQYLAENSGSWHVIKNLINRLDARRFRVVLVLPRPAEITAGLPTHVLVRYVPIPWLRARITVPYLVHITREAVTCMLALRRLIREERIDIVHCNTLPNIFTAFAAVSACVPLIWHVHELEFRPHAAFRVLTWWCRALADRLVCVSKPVYRLFGGSQKAVLIHNGIDLERFVPVTPERCIEARRKLGLAEDAFVVTFLGRIVPIKGVEWFICLAEEFLRRKLPGAEMVKFLVVGGPIAGYEHYYRAMLLRMCSELCCGHVIYVPAVADTHEVLAATDVLVQCSLIAESFGLTLVEAMAMERPVIANGNGGPSDIVRDGIDGFLVPSTDIVKRANLLALLCSDRNYLRRLGKNAGERTRNLFDADRMAREFELLYQSVCKR